MTKDNKVIKLDLGCGKNKIGPEWTGVDTIAFEGVDVVCNLAERESPSKKKGSSSDNLPFKKWPWDDNSVDEIHCSHFVEHLEAEERIHFVNELYRILKPECSARIIVPHWASCRAYGDLSHKFPPISEFWFYYLSSEWRKVNSPHTDYEITKNENHYKCNFEATWGYSLHPSLQVRNQEYQNFALGNFKEAAQDIIANLKKPKV